LLVDKTRKCIENVSGLLDLIPFNRKTTAMNTQQVIIRAASKTDLPQLLVFEQGVIAAERPFASNLKEGDITYYDIGQLIRNDDALLLIAEDNDKLVGAGYAKILPSKAYKKYSHYAYLGFMYVDPNERGKGINKMIIDELTNWAKSKNIKEMILDVYDDNEAAIRAYQKVGFKKNLVEMRVEID